MLWDTAGQEEFDAITKAYYRGAQAAVLAFSTVDRVSFDAIRSWKKKVGSFFLFLVIDDEAGKKKEKHIIIYHRVCNNDDHFQSKWLLDKNKKKEPLNGNRQNQIWRKIR